MAVITFSTSTPSYFATPADPTGTTNTSGLMMGLGATITPAFSGRVLVAITGNLTNSTGTAGNGAKTQIRYGTGTAPTNGSALAGTAIGSLQAAVLERATANDLQTFAVIALITNLTPTTTIWIDLSLAAVVGGTALAKNISITAIEV